MRDGSDGYKSTNLIEYVERYGLSIIAINDKLIIISNDKLLEYLIKGWNCDGNDNNPESKQIFSLDG